MVFYGPAGVGKTTVASIIAKNTKRHLVKLNGTTASTADIKEAVASTNTFEGINGVLLYLDEIQYFNKKQQQTLLEFMENGSITLIASTTENPYFYVYNAILSRSTVFEFKAVPPEEAERAVLRALELERERAALPLSWEDDVPGQIAMACGGDVRKAINAVELLCQAAVPAEGALHLTRRGTPPSWPSAAPCATTGTATPITTSSRPCRKSIRGSDPDAAVHYLGRLLEAGDLPSVCRRLLVCACEDVGLAWPQIIPVVKAAVDSALMVGLPEARIPLADAAVLVAFGAQVQFRIQGFGRRSCRYSGGKRRGLFPAACKTSTTIPRRWSARASSTNIPRRAPSLAAAAVPADTAAPGITTAETIKMSRAFGPIGTGLSITEPEGLYDVEKAARHFCEKQGGIIL